MILWIMSLFTLHLQPKAKVMQKIGPIHQSPLGGCPITNSRDLAWSSSAELLLLFFAGCCLRILICKSANLLSSSLRANQRYLSLMVKVELLLSEWKMALFFSSARADDCWLIRVVYLHTRDWIFTSVNGKIFLARVGLFGSFQGDILIGLKTNKKISQLF